MNNITYAVSVDVNNPIIPYNVYVANVLDSNVRYLEITLYQNGNVITLSNTATATASLVTDDVLVDDSVECTISNNIITVPLEDLQRHGNLDVQVTVTEGEKVLAIPFPIQVRVTPNIAENAQIDENSLGSYAEVVQEIAEARKGHDSLDERLNSDVSGMEAVINKVQSINSQSQTFDNDKYPSVTAVRNYVNTKTDDLQDYIENELDELDEAKASKTDTNAQFERLIAVLQRKADSAETLAGYGINDAYTKAEVTALNSAKADKADYTEVVQEIAEARGSYDKLKDRLDHTAAPTDEQVNEAVGDYFDGHPISGAEMISAAIAGKQDKLTAGENITIENGVISAKGDRTSPLADKNIVVFGDSLTDPQSGGISWTESFINVAEYNSFRGYGRGYCTWTFKNDTEYNITDNTDANVGSNVIWNQFNKLKHDVDNNNTPIPDIIIIFCADNDILQSKTIGSESATFKAKAQSSDVKTLTNMMDSIRYNIDTINAEYPNCIIVPIIPLLPSQYAKSKTYRDALITCYNNLGLSYIDVMYGSGIAWYREVMKKTYFADDGIHLSEAGSMKVAKFIYQSLITMPRIQKLPSTTTNKGLYNVYYNFTNATSTNSFASVMQGEPYRAIISATTTGYPLTSVTCTMGGVTQPVTGGLIDIANVTGDIRITAVGDDPTPTTYTVTNNLTNATNSNAATSVTEGDSYTATISANTGYHITSVTCTMGSTQQTVTNNTINIASVSGNIVITAVTEQGFVPVEGAYIHNDGNCWVGTSYYPTQNTTKLELVANVHSFSEGLAYGYLVGSTSTKLCQWEDKDAVACVAGGAVQGDANLVTVSYDKKFTLYADIANKVLTITDEDGTRTSEIIVGTVFITNPMWYFAGYWRGVFDHKSGDMKVYSMKIWEGDTLVYEGYPINDVNGAGMYDTITGTTNYNEGTGTLTYGVDSVS